MATKTLTTLPDVKDAVRVSPDAIQFAMAFESLAPTFQEKVSELVFRLATQYPKKRKPYLKVVQGGAS